jgi:hypothetical protein
MSLSPPSNPQAGPLRRRSLGRGAGGWRAPSATGSSPSLKARPSPRPEPAFKGEIVDGVAVMTGSIQRSFFDDKYETMQKGHQKEGEWAFCYAQQTALLDELPARGPGRPRRRLRALAPLFRPRRRHRRWASSPRSTRSGSTATSTFASTGPRRRSPFPTSSVDVIVCFYSIHHMVGRTLEETRGQCGPRVQGIRKGAKTRREPVCLRDDPHCALLQAVQSLLWNLVRSARSRDARHVFLVGERAPEPSRRENLPRGSRAGKAHLRDLGLFHDPAGVQPSVV